MKKFMVAWMAALCGLLAFSSLSFADTVIDDFGVVQGGGAGFLLRDDTNDAVPTTLLEAGLATSNVVGGSRFTSVSAISGAVAPGVLEAKVSVSTAAPGALSVSADAASPGVVGAWQVMWDANGAGLGGGSGIDLTSGGVLDRLAVDVLSADAGATTTFMLTDALNSTASLSIISPGVSSSTRVYFPFEDFVGVADLTAVTGIRMDITGPAATDMMVDRVFTMTVVPEPAGLGLLGIALLAVRRKRT